MSNARSTLLLHNADSSPGESLRLAKPGEDWAARPLDRLSLFGCRGSTVTVQDGEGRVYFEAPAQERVDFVVGGSLGTHQIRVLDSSRNPVQQLEFPVDAQTRLLDEDGRYAELFDILVNTMRSFASDGLMRLRWRGNTYYCFVYWILDHAHTAKGMRYFSPHTAGLVNLLSEAQREDGMIWSFARRDPGPGYYTTAYKAYGYAERDGGILFVRQPVENHCESDFVDAFYMAWKENGDDEWMKGHLDSAIRALDYTMNSPVRWSEKYQLLKRGYTIDSWDFQADDEYLVPFPNASKQNIDPERTKFGVFFGDNTSYSYACEQLAEMLDHAGRTEEAEAFRERAEGVKERLKDLAWNGRFYQHRVEEDPTVRRDFGVDETQQIAHSNAYSINRNIPHDQCVAIIETYLDLKQNLPTGSPGEWYAIYPPYERGFGDDSSKWQYMNAGVHGHVAGELALGSFEHGYEEYGADILDRARLLAKQTDDVLKFAYRGAVEDPPPPQEFTPIDISAIANMDLSDEGGEGVPHWMEESTGNDMRNLPVGEQTFEGVAYLVPSPAENGRRGAIAVAIREGFPREADILVNSKAGAVYLLHTSHGLGSSPVAGAITFRYADGSEETVYIQRDVHITGWWFPELRAQDAGVAWRGPNPQSEDVGVCWAALPNPRPEEMIEKLTFSASREGSIYAVMGVTLADRVPYHAPGLASTGGPDNWAGGTTMRALIRGLAGITDAATAFEEVVVSPRWTAAGTERVHVTARYGGSDGYVAYNYRHDEQARLIEVLITGSGDRGTLRLLLPPETSGIRRAEVEGEETAASIETIEGSRYAVVQFQPSSPEVIRIWCE